MGSRMLFLMTGGWGKWDGFSTGISSVMQDALVLEMCCTTRHLQLTILYCTSKNLLTGQKSFEAFLSQFKKKAARWEIYWSPLLHVMHVVIHTKCTQRKYTFSSFKSCDSFKLKKSLTKNLIVLSGHTSVLGIDRQTLF